MPPHTDEPGINLDALTFTFPTYSTITGSTDRITTAATTIPWNDTITTTNVGDAIDRIQTIYDYDKSNVAKEIKEKTLNDFGNNDSMELIYLRSQIGYLRAELEKAMRNIDDLRSLMEVKLDITKRRIYKMITENCITDISEEQYMELINAGN